MPAVLQIKVSDQLYLRDPAETLLGRNIVAEGVRLIIEIGFDSFTFKKLAQRIKSTEASVYRYFDSKHQLLKYLVSWYWNWLEYLIEYRATNINDPRRRLEIAIEVLTESDKSDSPLSYIDGALLHSIVVTDGARVYLTKQRDGAHAEALVEGYQRLCDLLVKFSKQIAPKYPYHIELATTLIATVHKQILYAEYSSEAPHGKRRRGDRGDIVKFLKQLIFTSLEENAASDNQLRVM
jgi:AcrR family transcriptional regulator